jgi:hypothetical protein
MGVQCTFDLCVVAVLLTLFTMRERFNRTKCTRICRLKSDSDILRFDESFWWFFETLYKKIMLTLRSSVPSQMKETKNQSKQALQPEYSENGAILVKNRDLSDSLRCQSL